MGGARKSLDQISVPLRHLECRPTRKASERLATGELHRLRLRDRIIDYHGNVATAADSFAAPGLQATCDSHHLVPST
eukprot:6005309-Prymnesium_polylepis.1